MSRKGTLPYAGINVPDSFSLAGFQVTTIGRIWVTAEADGESHFGIKEA
jgi:hypothetical protein